MIQIAAPLLAQWFLDEANHCRGLAFACERRGWVDEAKAFHLDADTCIQALLLLFEPVAGEA